MHHFIKEAALSVGFDACGIAKAEKLSDDADFMEQWLKEGKHSEMNYLARNFDKRTDPTVLVPGCKSVVVVLINYYPEQSQPTDAPKLAKYSYSEVDYHTIIKTKLNELEQKICAKYGSDIVSKLQHSFVDSAPVLERRWAERAGLGWLGKHTQLIHPGIGSYCFIGILLLNEETEYDKPIRSRCGGCTRCMDACPTGAINNGSIDARRCISNLTIENKNSIPNEFHSLLSGCALGCDICADVCPWNNKWATPHHHEALSPIPELFQWNKKSWQELNEKDFNKVFRMSAVKRAGFKKLKENIDLL